MLRRMFTDLRRVCRRQRPLQIALLLGFWLVGEVIARAANLAVPGSLIGLLLVLVLLASKRLSVRTLRKGADWFIAEMLLFFIPAVLAVLDHPELAGLAGLKILAVICLGTVIVMTVTAGAIELCFRLRLSAKRNHDVIAH